MNSIEELKNKLKQEGYIHIYEWTDKAGAKYLKHAHKGEVTFYVYKGDLTMDFEGGSSVTLREGDKFDVPRWINHTAVVGKNGCTFVVGEKIEGDS